MGLIQWGKESWPDIFLFEPLIFYQDGPFDVDAFVSKLASVERRDLEVEQDHPEKRLAWALGARLGVGLLNAARRVIDSSKEAINVSHTRR